MSSLPLLYFIIYHMFFRCFTNTFLLPLTTCLHFSFFLCFMPLHFCPLPQPVKTGCFSNLLLSADSLYMATSYLMRHMGGWTNADNIFPQDSCIAHSFSSIHLMCAALCVRRKTHACIYAYSICAWGYSTPCDTNIFSRQNYFPQHQTQGKIFLRFCLAGVLFPSISCQNKVDRIVQVVHRGVFVLKQPKELNSIIYGRITQHIYYNITVPL